MNSREGFITRGRKVFSILYQLEAPPPTRLELVVPLDCNGHSLNGLARPVNPSKRIVDVRPGDEIRFRDQTHRVISVEAFSYSLIDNQPTRPAYPAYRY